MMKIRLQKYMAECGVDSRRHSEEIIAQGRVRVNGKKVTTQGIQIDPNLDEVRVDGKLIKQPDEMKYYIFHKPEGYLSTVSDPQGRATIYDLIPELQGKAVPVGRLDKDTQGLLLLTNDGEFAYRMTHPKFNVKKTYRAKVEGQVTDEEIKKLEKGLHLEDGMTAPAKAKVIKRFSHATLIELTLREGKKRQVRRMCDAIEHPVLVLTRTQVEKLSLRDLPTGQMRELTEEEVMTLKYRLQLGIN